MCANKTRTMMFFINVKGLRGGSSVSTLVQDPESPGGAYQFLITYS